MGSRRPWIDDAGRLITVCAVPGCEEPAVHGAGCSPRAAQHHTATARKARTPKARDHARAQAQAALGIWFCAHHWHERIRRAA